MSAPRISLVIPVYNAERHLRACLDSVAGQTLREFECLCIDDGSTDASAGIVKAFADRDPRFRLIQQPNAGCSAARNTGIGLASAAYLTFLDADDFLHAQAFEIGLDLTVRHQADALAFGCHRVPDAFVPKPFAPYSPEALAVSINDAPFPTFFQDKGGKVKGGPVEVWRYLFRKDAMSGVRFSEGVHFAEDLVFIVKMMHSIRRLVSTQAPLVFHRDNPTSAINQGVTEKYMRSHALAAHVLRDYFAQKALPAEESGLLARYTSYMVYKTCVSQPLRKIRRPESRELLAYARRTAAELAAEGLFDASCLDLRKRLVTRAFLEGRQRLAAWLV